MRFFSYLLFLFLVGCSSSNYSGSSNEEMVIKERETEFSSSGNCLVLFKFTQLSVLKNLGYDGRYLRDSFAEAYYDDGQILITYDHDSLVLNLSSETMAISSSQRIAAGVKDGALGIGFLKNNYNSCVAHKPSFFVSDLEVERLSSLQPN